MKDFIDLPECDQEGCTNKAFFEYMWLDQKMHACVNHAAKVLMIGDAMEYDGPERTIRILPEVEETFAEVLPSYFEQTTGVKLPDNK